MYEWLDIEMLWFLAVDVDEQILCMKSVIEFFEVFSVSNLVFIVLLFPSKSSLDYLFLDNLIDLERLIDELVMETN